MHLILHHTYPGIVLDATSSSAESPLHCRRNASQCKGSLQTNAWQVPYLEPCFRFHSAYTCVITSFESVDTADVLLVCLCQPGIRKSGMPVQALHVW